MKLAIALAVLLCSCATTQLPTTMQPEAPADEAPAWDWQQAQHDATQRDNDAADAAAGAQQVQQVEQEINQTSQAILQTPA